jgi:putative endonuclease
LLVELGLDVLTRNYAGTRGEIDIVARDGVKLCFVEVKTRHRALRGRPGEAVGREKRRNLVRTAHQYLRELGHPPLAYRFDIVEIVLSGWRVVDLRYHRNAFTEEDVRRRPGQAFPSVGV